MPRWLKLSFRAVVAVVKLLGGLLLLIVLLPVIIPWLSNMQHFELSVFGQIVLFYVIAILICLVGFVVVTCTASKEARDELAERLRGLDVFKRKRAAIEGDGFSDQDRATVDEKICEAEAEVKASAEKLSIALRDDASSLLIWRRIHLRQSALSLADIRNENPTPSREKGFVRRLRVNQASIDDALAQIRQLVASYGIEPPAAPRLPDTPLFVAYSSQGGPKNGFLRFFWRIADAHVCVVKSAGAILSAYCLNFAYRGGFRRLKRVGRVGLWAVNAGLACVVAAVVLAVPPLVFDQDSHWGRRCAEALCRFYVKFTPRIEFDGQAGMETAEVPYLHAAAATGRRIAVESFLAAGADPQAGAINKGPTARELAAYLGHQELLDLLPTEQSDPLSVAVTQSNLSRARWLIWNSGRRDIVNVPDRFGISPLHYAVSSGNLDGVRLLIDQQANPNIRSKDFPVTPLHVAALRGDIAIVEFLLANGADPDGVEDGEVDHPFLLAKSVANLGRFERSALETVLRVPLPATRYHTISRLIEDASRQKHERERRK